MSPVTDPRFSSTRHEVAREAELADSNRIARTESIKALVMIGVGFAVGAGWPALQAVGDDGLGGAVLVVGVRIIQVAVSSIAGLVGLVVACTLLGSGAGHVPLALLRLAGIFSIVLIFNALFGPLGFFGFICTGAILAGLIALVFDLELKEGIVATVVVLLINIGVTMFLATVL